MLTMLKLTVHAAALGVDSLAAHIANCVNDINHWLSANCLQLNVGINRNAMAFDSTWHGSTSERSANTLRSSLPQSVILAFTLMQTYPCAATLT